MQTRSRSNPVSNLPVLKLSNVKSEVITSSNQNSVTTTQKKRQKKTDPAQQNLDLQKVVSTINIQATTSLVETTLSTAKSSALKSVPYLTVPQDAAAANAAPKKSPDLKLHKSCFVMKKTSSHLKDYSKLKDSQLLGQGAFGKVYKVVCKKTQDIRAMKVLDKDKITASSQSELINEIEILKKLDHPNILKVYEYYEDARHLYIVTEFVDGRDLLDEIYEQDTFTEAEVGEIMRQIFSGIAYIHENKLLHRDLKPENIMVERHSESGNKDRRVIKIIDWGTSAKLGAAAAAGAQQSQEEQFLSQRIGTIDYAAPEVFMRKYSFKVDVWSCGVILYILLSGAHPFGQATTRSAFDMSQKGKIYTLNFDAIEWKNVSDLAKDLVTKMLQPDPEKRISAKECLMHPWFLNLKLIKSEAATEQHIMRLNLQKLKKFRASSKLQEAALCYMASHLTTREDRRQLTNLFHKLDENGDGKLSLEEIKKGFDSMFQAKLFTEEQEIEELFKQIDSDGNGYISYNEFITACLDREFVFSKNKLTQAFKVFDQDGDGFIEAKELGVIFGPQLTDVEGSQSEVWKDIINEFDEDGDGKISFKEFEKFMHKVMEN